MSRWVSVAVIAVVAAIAVLHPPPKAAMNASVPVAMATQHAFRAVRLRAADPPLVVYVAGAIAHPGLYKLRAGSRVNDAVQRAGGLLADADPAAVNLAERLEDGQEIRVLHAGETAPAPKRSGRHAHRRAKKRSAEIVVPQGAIDVNAADAAALAALPGIGETLAERIVEFRSLNGRFASLDELLDVAGITQRRLDAIAPMLVVR